MSGPEGAPPLGAKTPRHLWDYWRIIWEGRRILLTVLGITLMVAIVGTLLMPRRYRAEALTEIMLSQPVMLGAVTERSASRSFFDVDREFKTEFVRIKTRDLVQKAIDEQRLRERVPDLAKMKDPVEILRRSIVAERLGQTQVASIGVTWGDPKEAAILANAMADTYVVADLEERTQQMKSRVERLRNSLQEKSAARKDVIERELAIIKSDRDFDELLNLSTLRERTTLQTLWEDLKTSRTDLAGMRTSYGPNNPSVLTAEAKVREVERQVDDALKAAVADLEQELTSLGGDPTRIQPSSEPISSIQQASNEKFEESLEERVGQEQILMHLAEPKARVIDAALPPRKPYSPRWSLNIMLALVVGLGFGGGLIFFRDYLDTSVKTLDDVERDLGLSLLAVMPLEEQEGRLDKVSLEAYQTLRTGLLFASGGRKDRVLLVTSSGPREGKTSVVRNLAHALAASGESVIAVDCDLRRASLTRALGQSRDKGLSTYLADPTVRGWKDLAVAVSPQLLLLPSGPLPPNPVDLLGTPRFRELLAELRQAHQWVIIDSPPISSVSDSVMLASMAEMVLVVMRHDQTDKEVVRRALGRLVSVGGRIIGAVLNGVDMKKAYNREYYYGRFYYGHYYGEEAGALPPQDRASALVARARKFLK